MALLALIIYTRVRVVRPFVCVNCVCIYTIERAYTRAYIYMRMHLYPREFAFVYTQKCKCSFLCAYACVRLRACLHADLIKTKNTFARKIFKHSNALWVQKLSGCNIYTYMYVYGCDNCLHSLLRISHAHCLTPFLHLSLPSSLPPSIPP